MIYLSGGYTREQIGVKPDIGIMLTYVKRGKHIARAVREEVLTRGPWAADNNCFNNPEIDVEDYLRWLKEYACGARTCLFATAPDIVGDAKATWLRSEPVLPLIRAAGLPAGFVAQDGVENTVIEWGKFDALFIGGTTEWKLSDAAFSVAAEAKRRGKWTHMGRVNSRLRVLIAALNNFDSVDGTHVAFKPDEHFADLERWVNEVARQSFLPLRRRAELSGDLY